MYLTIKETLIIEDSETELYGISDGNGLMITFTEDPVEAESFVGICNENAVESNHIADIIEDRYYT